MQNHLTSQTVRIYRPRVIRGVAHAFGIEGVNSTARKSLLLSKIGSDCYVTLADEQRRLTFLYSYANDTNVLEKAFPQIGEMITTKIESFRGSVYTVSIERNDCDQQGRKIGGRDPEPVSVLDPSAVATSMRNMNANIRGLVHRFMPR